MPPVSGPSRPRREQVGARRLQIAGDLGQRGFGIREPQIDLVAGIEQRCADRYIAEQRLDGEGIEAALQLLPPSRMILSLGGRPVL